MSEVVKVTLTDAEAKRLSEDADREARTVSGLIRHRLREGFRAADEAKRKRDAKDGEGEE